MKKLVVVVAVVLLAAACGSDGDESSGDAAEAVGIAQGFVEAKDTWDGEGTSSLVADDAIVDGVAASADEYLADTEFERATGRRYLEPECTTSEVGPPAEVTCTYLLQNAWSEALGVGPFSGSSVEFVIADGQIQQLTSNPVWTEFSTQVWGVYTAWLKNTHPDDFDVMIERTGGSEVPLVAPEAVALWEQHTTEFVASLSDP
jgi:hypothetical protein